MKVMYYRLVTETHQMFSSYAGFNQIPQKNGSPRASYQPFSLLLSSKSPDFWKQLIRNAQVIGKNAVQLHVI